MSAHTTSSMPQPSRRLARLSAGVALALAAALCACGAQGANTSTTDHTISVSSSAEVPAIPDVARITVTVETTGDSAKSAQKANGKPTKAVLACLDEQGVPKKRIQTLYTDLSPAWNEEDGSEDQYTMRTVLEVSGLPIDDLNELMELLADAGATEISGPDYYVSSYDELYQQALTDAVAAAQPKAEAIARASNAQLGDIVSVQEGYQDSSLRYKATNGMAMEESALDTGLADIEPGEALVSAEVTVTYAIR